MAEETVLTIVGNAVEDAQLRFTPAGAAVANFRIASTPRTFDKQANTWKDGEPLFLTVNVWRQMAEHCAEAVTKGTRVIIQGRLKQRSYEKDGQKRTVMEIEADEVGVSLKFATAKVSKMSRSGGGARSQPAQGGGFDDPWANQGAPAGAPASNFDSEPPF